MAKRIEFIGPERQSLDLRDILEFAAGFVGSLRGGATEVVLDYIKDNEGSVMTIRTVKTKPVEAVAEPVSEAIVVSVEVPSGVETTTTDAVTVEPVLDIVSSAQVEKKRRKSTEG
jgi:hypothetical protein